MDSIRVKNLHCLADTGTIPLKPINILIGANSSGKSSFVRIFPLLKQGLNTNKRGPILWLSEDVDFGDFKTAVRRGQKNIELQFEINPYKITLNIIDNINNDYINDIKIEFDDQIIRLAINNKREVETITINEEKFSKSIFCAPEETRLTILPIFFLKREFDILSNDLKIQSRMHRMMLLKDDSIEYINKILNNKISKNTVSNIFDSIKQIGSKANILQNIKDIESPKAWKNIVKNWDKYNSDFISLNNRILLSNSLLIIDYLNSELTRDLRGVSYIGPIRATAERYYRRQNLALNTIDSRGINLPLFLNELTEAEKKDLNSWILKHFGFSLFTDYTGGHIAISLIDPSTDEKINLADSGFGFSQIMPIIIVLWTLTSEKYLRRNRYYNNKYYFVIEQPELHLHPAFQAKLADVFISAIEFAKSNKINLKLILETHSESIINRVGRRISEQKISKDDVTVALFEKSLNKDNKNVTLTEFDHEGFLTNWPIGFFNAD